MADIIVGKGKLDGKGAYANRRFSTGEKVLDWRLGQLSNDEYTSLPVGERKFVHSFWGRMYLFGIPSRYTNHSVNPNTRADFDHDCDFAIRDIEKGEMITTNASDEILFELTTFVESYEKQPISKFKRLKGGYRNATVSYSINGNKKLLHLRREKGNWCAFNTG